jgi:glycogen operon protein
MHWDSLPFELPGLRDGMKWFLSANTGLPSPEDIHEPGSEPELGDQSSYLVGGRSVVIMVGK